MRIDLCQAFVSTAKFCKVVLTSTWDTPSMALIFSKNSPSGKNSFSSHGPKSPKGTVVMSLKSRQDPHTSRFTFTPSDTSLIFGRYSSTTLAMASRDSESALFPVYLQRHSRHTRSNDMDPLARGTGSALSALVVRPKAGTAAGLKAWIKKSEFNGISVATNKRRKNLPKQRQRGKGEQRSSLSKVFGFM